MKEGRGGFGQSEEFLPKRERTLGHARVNLIRPITHPNHARLAARTRAAVSSSVCVQEDDFSAGAPHQVSRPRAENAGAHDGYIESFVSSQRLVLRLVSQLATRLTSVPVLAEKTYLIIRLGRLRIEPLGKRLSSLVAGCDVLTDAEALHALHLEPRRTAGVA